jgi:hypothetical protein
VGVSKEGKVSDCRAAIGQPLTLGKAPFHHVERPLAADAAAFQALRLRISGMEVGPDVAGNRDEGLVAVLLSEQPLQHTGASETRVWQPGGPFGEVGQDRV